MGASGFRVRCRQQIELWKKQRSHRDFENLLASPNICGKRWVWQQYDHMVQTNTVEAPGRAKRA